MKTLLIPTSFTDVSRHATDYAIRLFGGEKLRIVLLNAFEQPRTGRSVPLSILDIMKKNSEKGLEEDRKRIEEIHRDLDCDIVTRSCQGDLSDAIKSVLHKRKIDLIVMGSTGSQELVDIFVESITARVIKTVEHPMLIVPPHAKLNKLESIIFATDNQPISDPDIVKPLTDLCKKQECEIRVLNVSRTGINTSPDTEVMLGEVFKGIKHDFNYRQSADIPRGIYKFMYETNADIVSVVRRRGNGKLVDILFTQSVSRRIVKHVRQTLLLFNDRKY